MLKMVVAAASISRSVPDRDLRTNFNKMRPHLTKLLTAKDNRLSSDKDEQKSSGIVSEEEVDSSGLGLRARALGCPALSVRLSVRL